MAFEKKGAKKITGLDGYLVKEQNLSYLGTLHFSTLCFVTRDLTFITQAEVTVSNIPHLPVVPDCAIIQTASLGRHTLLTALPSTLHFVLPLQNINNHWGFSEPFHVGKVTPEAWASELNDFQLPSDTWWSHRSLSDIWLLLCDKHMQCRHFFSTVHHAVWKEHKRFTQSLKYPS